ncbi:MAG TPA: glycine cleavage system protein H [Terriglobales bacterium]|nr:glycine cleavage system protein H [Terriglobales bacterium]
MSILFVLLMFLLIMSISYFRGVQTQPGLKPEPGLRPQTPRLERELGFAIPQGYCFHPGHTWMLKEGADNVRVGLDSFAGNLIGKIDRLEVVGPNRWVRQGQKLMSVHAGGNVLELLSPVEGVVVAVNHDAIEDPTLLTRDPYKDGWVAMVKSPDLAINQKNLVQSNMVAPWMQNNVSRLNGMLAQLSPQLAQDGGLPVSGILARVNPELRQKLTKEFFLS